MLGPAYTALKDAADKEILPDDLLLDYGTI
jgi:hypothetical protein